VFLVQIFVFIVVYLTTKNTRGIQHKEHKGGFKQSLQGYISQIFYLGRKKILP